MTTELATSNGNSPLLPAVTPLLSGLPPAEPSTEAPPAEPDKPELPFKAPSIGNVTVKFKRSLGDHVEIEADLDLITFDVFTEITKLQEGNEPEIQRIGKLMDVLTPICGRNMRQMPAYVCFEVLNQIVAQFGAIVPAKN